MSLPRNRQEELFSAINELPDFLPEDDPMMVFSREIYPAFTDEDFEDCCVHPGFCTGSIRLNTDGNHRLYEQCVWVMIPGFDLGPRFFKCSSIDESFGYANLQRSFRKDSSLFLNA
jgi:hypothetical protein